MSPRRIAPGATLAGLACSAAALAIAPALMPTSYSWIAHTTSESAAQGVPGAWLGRLGLTLFGLSVLGLAWLRRAAWGPWAAGLHLCFGGFMVVAGAFSTRPWIGADYDHTEDLVHSVAATAIGFAFAFGVVLTALRRRRAAVPPPWRVFDLAAVAASVLVPLAMTFWPDAAGLLQRCMFAISYAWYAREAVLAAHR